MGYETRDEMKNQTCLDEGINRILPHLSRAFLIPLQMPDILEEGRPGEWGLHNGFQG